MWSVQCGVEGQTFLDLTPNTPVAENFTNGAAATRWFSALLQNFKVVFKFLGSQKIVMQNQIWFSGR